MGKIKGLFREVLVLGIGILFIVLFGFGVVGISAFIVLAIYDLSFGGLWDWRLLVSYIVGIIGFVGTLYTLYNE